MNPTDQTEDIILCHKTIAQWTNPKTESIENIEQFIWKTKSRMEISVITFGARLTSIKIPDRFGTLNDILLGHDTFEDYEKDTTNEFGAVIGPVSGIIKNAEYCIKGRYHKVPRNYLNQHCLDSGSNNLQRSNWSSHIDGKEVILSQVTDGTNGFPAVFLIQVTYSVTSNNHVMIRMTARSNKVATIDLSIKLYLNLMSHGSGPEELENHLVCINSSKYNEKDDKGIFKRSFVDICESDVEIKIVKEVKEIFKKAEGTFNRAYAIDMEYLNDEEINIPMAMRIIHPTSGRILEIFTNQSTLYVSTCPDFPEDESGKELERSSSERLTMEYLRTKLTEQEIKYFQCKDPKCKNEECEVEKIEDLRLHGKDGAIYVKNCAFCVSCHNQPNAPNHQKKCPDVILKPGAVYENVMVLKFRVHVLESPSSENFRTNKCNC